jgi:hypothetical protein
MTIDQMVQAAIQYAQDGVTITVAAEKAYSSADPEAVDHLAKLGLANLVSKAFYQERRRGPVGGAEGEYQIGSGRYQFAPQPEETARGLYWLQKPVRAADGIQRPLLHFTLEDATYWHDHASQELAGWSRQKHLAASVVKALEEHPEAFKVKALPQVLQESLNKLAERMLG